MANSTAAARYTETTDEAVGKPVRSRWFDTLTRFALVGAAAVGVEYIGAGRTALALGLGWAIGLIGTPR